jgi:hypothetical protein
VACSVSGGLSLATRCTASAVACPGPVGPDGSGIGDTNDPHPANEHLAKDSKEACPVLGLVIGGTALSPCSRTIFPWSVRFQIRDRVFRVEMNNFWP